MIYLVYGSDRDKVLTRVNGLLSVVTPDLSDILLVRLNGEEFEKAKFEELIDGRSLFSKKIVVLIDNVLSNADARLFVCDRMDKISSSPNVFIFRDSKVDKKILDIFKNHESKIEEFNLPDTERGYAGAREVNLRAGYENFNVFEFTDAIGRRDKKGAWVLYQKALRAGFPAEELFWKAVWIFRHIILAGPQNSDRGSVSQKLKVSPFVFKKAASFVGHYRDELPSKYKKLVTIYHDARRGLVDMEMAMEQFLLTL